MEGRAGGAGVRPALRGAASTAAMADAQETLEREGDELVTEMVRIKGVLDAAFPLLTAFRDRARAELWQG